MAKRAYRLAPAHPEDHYGPSGLLTPAYISTQVYRTQPEAEEAAVTLTYVYKTKVNVIAVWSGARWGEVVYTAGF